MRKRKALVAAVALAALGCLEMAARLTDRGKEPPDGLRAWGYREWPRFAGNFIPHPFTSFALNPEHPEHSAQGLRAREIYATEHAGTRIVALGGSNTYGTQVPWEDTYPLGLQRELEKLDDGPVEVVNAGVGAYTTANIISHLSLRVLELDPEICLFDVGFTDAVARLRYPDFEPDYSHDYKAWDLPSPPLWRRSALLDRIARKLGRAYDWRPSIHLVCQHPDSDDLQACFEQTTIGPFRRNVVTLIGICRAHGITPVLCTQAVDFAGHPADRFDETWEEAMRQANDAVRSVAEEEDVLLIDLDRQLGGRSELFADDRRMNGDGNRIRAEIVAQALLPLLE